MFATLSEASNCYGVTPQAIYKAIKFERALAGTTFRYLGDSKRPTSTPSYIRVSECGKEVGVFPSTRAIAKHFNISFSTVGRCLKAGSKLLGKYDLKETEPPKQYKVLSDDEFYEFYSFTDMASYFNVHINTPERSFREGRLFLNKYSIKRITNECL